MLWVFDVQDIKIINSRNVVFNESEIPCTKNKIENPKEKTDETISQIEVKLAKLSHTQLDNAKVGVQQSNENIVNKDEGEVQLSQTEVETEIENPNIPTIETSTQDYQLIEARERR